MTTPAVTPLPSCGCTRRLIEGEDPSGHDFVVHNDCALTAGLATTCTRCHVWAGKALPVCPVGPPTFEARAYTVFRVDCEGCGSPNDLGDADPDGEVIDCDGCGAKITVTGAP